MKDVSLAELYQGANIAISVDDFKLRQGGFSSIDQRLTNKQLIDLCRIYFGWWDNEAEFAWFVDAFKQDPRFTLEGNRRELSVLASGLILSALKSGNAVAGLTAVCASLAGKRKAAVPGIDTSVFEDELKNLAVETSGRTTYNFTFKEFKKAAIKEKMAEDNTVATLATNVSAALTEVAAINETALADVQTLVATLATDLAVAREQINILSWLVSGWSRALNRPFSKLGMPLAAVCAGFDLADLSFAAHGPYAAEALLTRVLVKVNGQSKIYSIASVADSPSGSELSALGIDTATISECLDICPLSAALLKKAAIGGGTAWHAAFDKTSHAKPSTSLTVVDVARQAMYERLLLRFL